MNNKLFPTSDKRTSEGYSSESNIPKTGKNSENFKEMVHSGPLNSAQGLGRAL